jgi:hypothetical protein
MYTPVGKLFIAIFVSEVATVPLLMSNLSGFFFLKNLRWRCSITFILKLLLLTCEITTAKYIGL